MEDEKGSFLIWFFFFFSLKKIKIETLFLPACLPAWPSLQMVKFPFLGSSINFEGTSTRQFNQFQK